MTAMISHYAVMDAGNETGLKPFDFDNLFLWKKGSVFLISNGTFGKSNGYYTVVNNEYYLKLEIIDGKGPDTENESILFHVRTGKDADNKSGLCVTAALIGQRWNRLPIVEMAKLKVGSIVRDGRGFTGTLVATEAEMEDTYSWKVTYYANKNGEEVSIFHETYDKFGYFDVNQAPYSDRNIREVLYRSDSF